LREQGKIRAAGISGLPLHHLRGLAEASDLDFLLSYCHYNLLADDLPQVLGPLAKDRGLGLINASPLHMGVLSGEGPPPWHPADESVKEAGRRVLAFCRDRGLDAAAISLRKSLDLPCLSATLVGMKTVEQVDANLAVLEATADPRLLEEIDVVVGDAKNRLWSEGRPVNNP
jgi:L-galactose dehydrogenase